MIISNKTVNQLLNNMGLTRFKILHIKNRYTLLITPFELTIRKELNYIFNSNFDTDFYWLNNEIIKLEIINIKTTPTYIIKNFMNLGYKDLCKDYYNK